MNLKRAFLPILMALFLLAGALTLLHAAPAPPKWSSPAPAYVPAGDAVAASMLIWSTPVTTNTCMYKESWYGVTDGGPRWGDFTFSIIHPSTDTFTMTLDVSPEGLLWPDHPFSPILLANISTDVLVVTQVKVVDRYFMLCISQTRTTTTSNGLFTPTVWLTTHPD